jgi:hypothetical protein
MGLFDKKNSANTHNAKVKALLAEAMPDVDFIEEAPGLWGTRNESVLVKIFVDTEMFPDMPFVSIAALTIIGANDDLSLYKNLMTERSAVFGKWEVEESDEKGKVDIYLVTRLLLADLDASELGFGIASTAFVADENDEGLQKQFGGKRCLDQFGWTE